MIVGDIYNPDLTALELDADGFMPDDSSYPYPYAGLERRNREVLGLKQYLLNILADKMHTTVGRADKHSGPSEEKAKSHLECGAPMSKSNIKQYPPTPGSVYCLEHFADEVVLRFSMAQIVTGWFETDPANNEGPETTPSDTAPLHWEFDEALHTARAEVELLPYQPRKYKFDTFDRAITAAADKFCPETLRHGWRSRRQERVRGLLPSAEVWKWISAHASSIVDNVTRFVMLYWRWNLKSRGLKWKARNQGLTELWKMPSSMRSDDQEDGVRHGCCECDPGLARPSWLNNIHRYVDADGLWKRFWSWDAGELMTAAEEAPYLFELVIAELARGEPPSTPLTLEERTKCVTPQYWRLLLRGVGFEYQGFRFAIDICGHELKILFLGLADVET